MLPKQVLVAALIECGLIVFTTGLLTLPRFLAPHPTDRALKATTYLGVLFLGVTFCWSVILGSVLTLNGF